ncbi:MAG TPA: hypothetical protein VJI96_05405 [Candidatus Andersenbacteria bacterium]|nr:hypothetical protein [Candidatus Andersenbacteria bacterium]
MDDPKNTSNKEDESGISMLRRNLYSKEEPIELKKRTQELLTPKQPTVHPEAIAASRPDLINIMDIRAQLRRKFLIRTALIITALVIFVGGVSLTIWYRGTQQVKQSQLALTIGSPERFTAGGIVTYTVDVTNNSNVDWGTVDVTFTTPEGFFYESSTPAGQASEQNITASLGELLSKKSVSFTVTGRLIGEEGATALARAEVAISPKNFPKEKIVQSQTAKTLLAAIPLEVSVEAGKSAAVGERIAAIIHIRNLSSAPIEGAVLKLTPAPGMQLAIEDTGFSADFSVIDSFWRLPVIQPLDEVVRYSVLYVSGNSGDQRQLDIAVLQEQKKKTFTLREISHVISLISSQLTVAQTFNKNESGKLTVSAGDRVDGVIAYKNTGGGGLTDAIVKVKFEGTGLDASTIKLNSGAYDPISNTITWTASSVPALARILPGTGGQIAYSFNMLPYDKFPLAPNGKNQQLIATATLDSPDLPKPTGEIRQVISDRFFLPVTTSFLLGSDAFYDDGRLGITSTGPLPPKVGEQTTYTLRIRMGSSLNDIEQAKVVIVLPDGVSYTDTMYKTAGDIDFNSRTNTFVWTMPLLEGLVGRAVPLQELHMQIAITPGANVRGQIVQFVKSIDVVGIDSFTDQQVKGSITSLPTTRTADNNNGDVE